MKTQCNRQDSSSGMEVKVGLPLGVMATKRGAHEALARLFFDACCLHGELTLWKPKLHPSKSCTFLYFSL